MVLDAWAMVSSAAERNDVKLDADLPDHIDIFTERARMERVFVNLMENAIEAMPHGGEIRVRVQQAGGETTVVVEDTGPGINASISDRLFQPFVSAGKKNGLGLGLALSRQTVLDNGGDMWVDRSCNSGARFCLRLPLAKVEVE
jgi:two-component system C4-dicarboxylate transport sensor histidine kinase DctB